MIQRQVGSRLNNRDDGVGARLRRSLEDIQNFKLDNADAQKQMEDMLARLDVIRDRHLGPAEQGISRASKSLDDAAAKPAAEPSPPGMKPAHSPTRAHRPIKCKAQSEVRRESVPGLEECSRTATPEARRLQSADGRRSPGQSTPISPRIPAANRLPRKAVLPRAISRRIKVHQASRQRASRNHPPLRRAEKARRRNCEGRARRGQGESEGDRRRAAEDARWPE